MGKLIDGQWVTQKQDIERSEGRFRRQQSAFRNWVTPDGRPGPGGEGGFAAEPGRYRLYISHACPWCHRVMMMRALKGLESAIPVAVCRPYMGGMGWDFSADPDDPEIVPDPEQRITHAHELYQIADPNYTGRATLPVLWDTARDTMVSNESADLIEMLNSAFDAAGAQPGDYRPAALSEQIESWREPIYHAVNNGVYKAGFATRQEIYEAEAAALFEMLDRMESWLTTRRYLCGDRITLADIRALPTLIRFDPVYVGHFKCNLRRLADYPALWGYCRDLAQIPAIRRTINLDHIKRHYYQSHDSINPTGIVPLGPEIDFDSPHDRARLSAAQSLN